MAKSDTAPQSDHANAPLKIILVGESGVGKSKLMQRFLHGEYDAEETTSTFALTMHRRSVECNGRNENVELWDTAGQERFHTLHSSYYFGAQCAVLVCDVTRPETLQQLRQWHIELRRFREHTPVLFVVNKLDTVQDNDASFNRSPYERFAKEINAKHVFWCSASTGAAVDELFNTAVQTAMEFRDSASREFVDDALHIGESLGRLDLDYHI
ncbi:MAG: hypothetical protein MHM6MM_003360 [Cercozoa sp. M6MM]